jgi:hypothetical protein
MEECKELRQNPPKLQISGNAKEVIFKTISCMCDNVRYFRFKKNNNGDFRLDCIGYAYSNFQLGVERFELEWYADNESWSCIIDEINKGYTVVESVQSR